MWEYRHTDELYHYGIPGMKWGVRKAKSSKSGGLFSRKKKRDTSSEDSKEVAKIRKKKLHQMTNEDLKTANKRLEMETKYRELTGKSNVGKRAVQAFIATGTTITAIEAAARVYKKLTDNAVGKLSKLKR